MSDESTWAPPPPGATPVPVEPQPAPRSRGPIIAAVVGAAALIGAGVFAVSRVVGDDAAGGAESPEAAGLALLDALDQEDVLGVVDLLLPGERETMREPLVELVDELSRIEVLSDDATLEKVSGVEVQIEDGSVDVEATNIEDIVNLRISATATATVDGEALPIGDLVLDIAEGEPSELDVAEPAPEQLEIPITAVREDGRWYLSAGYTIAEAARAETGEDIPETGVAPVGGDTPEDAMDNLIEGLEALDLTRLVSALNPDEFQALQRYAPLFLADAQAALDEQSVTLTAEDAEYTVSGDGDRRSVTIDRLHVAFSSAEGDGTVTFEDGCWKIEAAGQSVDACRPEDMLVGEGPGEVPEEIPEELEDLQASLAEAFEDVEPFGFVVERVDGKWYVSPIATLTDSLLNAVRALSREELEELQVSVQELVDLLSEETVIGDVDVIEDYSPPAGGGWSSLPPEDDPASECYGESEAQAAADCFQALVDDGAIESEEVPIFLRFPECGLAEQTWSGEYYSLPDAEFVALVTEAAPCFQDLVAAGELEEWELPPELVAPECLEGQNWYAEDVDEAFIESMNECAYG